MSLNGIWFNTKWQQNGLISSINGKFWCPAGSWGWLQLKAPVHHARAAGGEVERLNDQLPTLHVERHHPVLGVLLPALGPPPRQHRQGISSQYQYCYLYLVI